MTRVAFFALLVSCGSPSPARVEIAQPLPAPSATVMATEPSARRPAMALEDPGDPRPQPMRPLSTVADEARALEQLRAASAANGADRPSILFRLAEDYVELRKLGDASASDKARHLYEEISTTYPTFAKIEDVYFGLGKECETTPDWPCARRAYYELIKKSPTSTLVPYAYFAFGRMFATEAKTDPSKWDFAKQAFIETMRYDTSPVMPEAMCGMIQAFEGLQEAQQAAEMREKLVKTFPDSPAARRCGGP